MDERSCPSENGQEGMNESRCPAENGRLQGKDILCISSLDWDVMWTSKQQIMHRLARHNRVLYVEEPVTILAPFRVPQRWKRWKAAVPRLEEKEPNLWTLTPPPLLPFGNMRPFINRLNQRILALYIRWAMEQLTFGSDYLFWTYLPTSIALLDLVKRPGLVVYHCVDEHSAFPGFVSPQVVKSYDNALTRRADLVICTAESLRSSRVGLNSHTYTVHNAAEVELFSQALDPNLAVPEDLARIASPRLGFVGMHDARLDLDALETLAEADPAWQVVLIGPLKAGQVDESRLRKHKNIHLLGEKPQRDLPGYLKGLDVALIPYKPSELTRNIFPLKLFEYLAAGLPVVVGGLPELERYAPVIEIARSPQEYPGLVRKVMTEDNPTKRAARTALAAQNSWEHRVKEICQLVEAAIERKRLAGMVVS